MTARVRISRVRFKSGGEVRLLAPAVSADRAAMEAAIRSTLDAVADHCGMAILVWTQNNVSAANVVVHAGGRLPLSMVPDFVKTRLQAEIIEKWTLDAFDRRFDT